MDKNLKQEYSEYLVIEPQWVGVIFGDGTIFEVNDHSTSNRNLCKDLPTTL